MNIFDIYNIPSKMNLGTVMENGINKHIVMKTTDMFLTWITGKKKSKKVQQKTFVKSTSIQWVKYV